MTRLCLCSHVRLCRYIPTHEGPFPYNCTKRPGSAGTPPGLYPHRTHGPGEGEMSVQPSLFDLAALSDAANKHCRACDTRKPLSAFRQAERYRGGVYSYCMECEKALRHARYTSPEYRKWARERAASDEYKTAALGWRVKLRYGISLADYEAMSARQGDVCGICGRTNKCRLAVDHDHACCNEKAKSCGNCLRALLCAVCNRSVGWMEVNGVQNEYTDTWRLRIAREIPNPWDELVSA